MENNLEVFKSDKFDVENTASLSLFIYPHTFLVLAKNNEQKITAIHLYETFDRGRLEEYFKTDSLLGLNLPVQIYFHEPIFTLVPWLFYVGGKEKNYLEVLSEDLEKPYFFYTPIDSGNIHVLSYIPESTRKLIIQKFSNLTILHGSSSFLSYLIKEKNSQIGEEIFVNYAGAFIYLAGFSGRELVVFNRFETESKEDILKYILIAIKTLKFDQNHVRVTIYGAMENSGISDEWGNSFFSNFRITKPYTNQDYSSGLNLDYLPHLFEFFWQHH